MTVSSSTNRVSYAGNGSTTVFPYTYKIFDEDDLTVILRAANGTETVKTITSDYTVSGVGNAGGGNVTMLTAPASGETLVILREQDLVQELDIVPNDPFPADSLEAALDKLTFMVQQHQETLNRTIKASRTNTISGAEFTISAADRANKLFAFDSAGDLSIAQELGTYRGDWAASTAYNERDIVKDGGNDNLYFCNTAHTSSGSLPISTNTDAAKWDLLLDVAAFTTLYDQFDDRYLGAKNSDPALDNDGNALIDGALYWNTTDNRLKVYDLGNTTWEFTAPSPAEQANIDALGPIAADVSAVAAIDSDVTAVAAIDTDVTTVAGIAADVSAVAAIDSDVTAVAADATDIGTVATGIADVSTVAGISANVTTVAGISGNVTTVAGISADVTSVAGVAANVTTVAGISANVTTVAGISANVTTVAGISADVTTVAANVAGVTSFAEKYRVGANDPTTSLDEGDLFYNTSSNLLKVYNGSAWETGVTPGSGFLSASNNLSDLADASTARDNLGVEIGADVLAYVAPGTSGNILTSNGTIWESAAPPSSAVQYPQESKSADYTLVLADAGKQIFHPASDTATRTFTIPANSSVAFPIGTTVVFVNQAGAGAVTINITSDTMRVAGTATSGSFILSPNGIATAIKIASTEWIVYGEAVCGDVIGQQAYTTPGTYSWVAPSCVYSVSAVCVGGGGGGMVNAGIGASGGGGGGLGWKNSIPVVPGTSYTIVVGSGGGASATGGNSYFISSGTVQGNGGVGSSGATSNNAGGGYVGDGGGNGGSGGPRGASGNHGGGGGAGGYSGNGGAAGAGTTSTGSSGSGGGGGGGSGGLASSAGGGGGVGILGEGSNGAGGSAFQDNGDGGSGGSNGSPGTSTSVGGAYGGGGGAVISGTPTGGSGAVRLIWGFGRAFPSTRTGDE